MVVAFALWLLILLVGDMLLSVVLKEVSSFAVVLSGSVWTMIWMNTIQVVRRFEDGR